MMCLKFLQWGSAPPAVALAKIFGSFFQTLNRKLFFRFLYLKKPLESKPHRFSPDHFFVWFRMTKKEFFFIFLWVVGWHFLQFAEVGPLHSPCFQGILTLFFLIFSHFAVGTWLIFSYFFFFFPSYFFLFCLILSHFFSLNLILSLFDLKVMSHATVELSFHFIWLSCFLSRGPLTVWLRIHQKNRFACGRHVYLIPLLRDGVKHLTLSKETKTFSNKMKNLVKGDQNSVLFAKICKKCNKM
jgi:hypothetical protein